MAGSRARLEQFSDRASFAVPSKDPTSFYLCANPVFFRLCGKIATFATAHGQEKINYLLVIEYYIEDCQY